MTQNNLNIDINISPASAVEMASNLLYRSTNIIFLSLTKFYSDNSYTIVSNQYSKEWMEYFTKYHMDEELMESRLTLGQSFWHNSNNRKIISATKDAMDNFGFSKIRDITKINMSEIGCYDIYTFGLKKQDSILSDEIHDNYNNALLHFIMGIEKEAHFTIIENKRLISANREKLNSITTAKKNRINQWQNDYEYICDIMGHNYKPSYH